MNLIDRNLEVFTDPIAGKTPRYRTREVFSENDRVSLSLGESSIARIRVKELLAS